MNWIEIAGQRGAVLSGNTFIPQSLLAWKTKSEGDLSLTMMVFVISSTIIRFFYATSPMLWPVIVANCIVGLLS
ncbi:MAG: PQ-loop domain-containing transporter [Bacteroidota bacterium]